MIVMKAKAVSRAFIQEGESTAKRIDTFLDKMFKDDLYKDMDSCVSALIQIIAEVSEERGVTTDLMKKLETSKSLEESMESLSDLLNNK